MSISFCDFLRKTVNSSYCIVLYMAVTGEIVKMHKSRQQNKTVANGSRLLYCHSNVRTFTWLSFR